MNQIPSAERLHIGVFGRTNSGKSSFVNVLTGQAVSIVSNLEGTTTDPVYKPMELHPLGACVFMDTPGFMDETSLGDLRMEKMELVMEKTELAVLVLDCTACVEEKAEEPDKVRAVYAPELDLYHAFKEKNVPVLFVINKVDLAPEMVGVIQNTLKEQTGEPAVTVDCMSGEGIDLAKVSLARKVPQDFGTREITAQLVTAEDVVLLVMPQDIQAPKGRLILPQVQTIRELLDKRCVVLCVTTEQMDAALAALVRPPKLIITDSQVFKLVYEKKPKESMLTSFSVLFAAYKGDLPYYVEGAKVLDSLHENSKVLIAECCTHAPQTEDIGRVKLPNLLKKRYGNLQIEWVNGNDYPKELTEFDLIIQCGACMFNRSYVVSRITRAKEQGVPMTNYGVALAHLSGILEQITLPQEV